MLGLVTSYYRNSTEVFRGPLNLKDKIAMLKEEMARLKTIEVKLQEAPDKQVSLTDPDARSMKSRGNGIVGYNVQTVVDAEHHLIVAHEVTNKGSDRGQLTPHGKTGRRGNGCRRSHCDCRCRLLQTCRYFVMP